MIGSNRRKLLRQDGQGGPLCSLQATFKGELDQAGEKAYAKALR